jgi:phenylalanyl-tRNA synthetase beta chain
VKISVNWIKEFTDIKLSTDELVKRIGAQLGEVESVVDLSEKYKGIVIAKVLSCEKHPNADKLQVCLIDDGKKTKGVKRNSDGLVQVVCGAPNVRAGLTVAWIPPGSIVPSTYDGEQFKLDIRPLRGIDSNGMIASPKELAVSDDHYGILVIDKPAKPGQAFAQIYDLDDTVIDIENKMFTHRPDLFGILGIARELAGIQGLKFKSPKWYQKSLELSAKSREQLPLKVENKLPKLVPRIALLPMAGTHVQPSPIIMQSYLSRLGLKPINNIVDITNFVMMLTAQPLHAYDYDKLCSIDKSTVATIVVRKPKAGEKIRLLNGKTITPNKDSMMIASKSALIGVGGVMGGADTEVDNDTKNIVLECANFDMYEVRRSSMNNGLFTDAVTRFNKGQSTLQNQQVISYAVAMVEKLSGGKPAGKVIDNKHVISKPKPVKTDTAFINSRLGLDLTTSEIVRILSNVEFEVERNRTELKVKAPFWRTDIEIAEDVVEEVGRLYGYDHLPLDLPIRSVQPAPRDELLGIKSSIRSILSSAGANEVLTYSFVHGDLLDRTQQNKKNAYKLTNALSPELQYYRLTLIPSLLEKVRPNIKSGFDQFAIYEIGKSHNKTHVEKGSKLPLEMEMTALVWASKNKTDGAPYYQARQYLEELANKTGMDLQYSPISDNPKYDVTQPFDLSRSAYASDKNSGTFLGVIGEFKTEVTTALKLPDSCAGFEIGTEGVLSAKTKVSQYKVLSRYPSTNQDISFKVSSKTDYAGLQGIVDSMLGTESEKHGYDYNLEPLDIYLKGVIKHIAFRVTLSHPERTLVTEEVNKLLDSAANHAKKQIGATRI